MISIASPNSASLFTWVCAHLASNYLSTKENAQIQTASLGLINEN